MPIAPSADQFKDLGAPAATPPNTGARRTTVPLLPRFFNALAATAANLADTNVAVLGDSIMAGAYATGSPWVGARPLSPPSVLAQILSNYFEINQDSVFGDSSLLVPLGQYDPRMSATTNNWNVFSPAGLGGQCFRNDTNEESTLSMRTTNSFDTITVRYLQSPGGASFNVRVAGGIPLGATVSTVGGLDDVIITRTCPRVTGPNRIDIQREAGAGALPIYSIEASDSTKRRVNIYNWGYGGSSSNDWASVVNVYDPPAMINSESPHLTFICVGVNDALLGTVPATYITNMQTLIDNVRVTSDIVLCIPSPVATGSSSAATQFGLYSLLRDLGQKNGVPVCDVNALFGNYLTGVAAGYYLPANEAVHPGAAGQAAIATLFASVPGVIGY
jgi:lysophospholipase L1-like esterase